MASAAAALLSREVGTTQSPIGAKQPWRLYLSRRYKRVCASAMSC